MTKALTSILSLFLLSMCLHAQAQSLKTSWAIAPPSSIHAGETYTASLKIRNTSDTLVSLQAKLKLPKGWLNLSLSEQLDVPPNKTVILLLPFRAQSAAIARTYQFLLDLKTPDGVNIKNIRRKIKVLRGYKVTVENLSKRSYAISKQKFTTNYHIINRSNVPLELELKTQNQSILGEDTIYLRPGASTQIEAVGIAPKAYGKNRNFVYGLSVNCDDFDTTTTFTESFEIFPDNVDDQDIFQRLPTTIGISYFAREVFGQYQQGVQANVSMKGSINSKKNDLLEVKFQGPNRQDVSLSGNFANYFTRYRNKNFQIWAGHQPLSVSRLTESSRAIIGVTSSVKLKKFNLEGFYGESRFFPDLKDEYGAKLTFKPTDKFSIGTATLRKNFVKADSSAIIPTIFSEYNARDFKFSSEFSYGTTGTKDGYAFDLQGSALIKTIRFTGHFLNADQFYPGFLRNSRIASFNVRKSFKKFTLGVNASYRNTNPSLDTFFVAAPIAYNFLTSFNYQLNPETSLVFRTGQIRRTDRFEPKRFDYIEFNNRITFRQNFSIWNYQIIAEYGRNNNFLLPEDARISASYISGFNGSVRLSDRFSTSLNLVYQNTNRYSIDRFSSFIAGGSLLWQYGENSRVSLNFQSNYDIEEIYQTQDQIQLRLNQDIGSHNNLSVSVRYAKPRWRTQNERSLFLTANYVFRFGTPLRKKKNIGTINGRISTLDSVGVSDVRLRISNSKSVSDEAGNFQFSRLTYGTYYLTLDRASIDVRKIATEPLPIKVELSAQNPNANFDIKVVDAGSIVGQIQYPKIKNKLLDSKSKVFRPVYIEITNGKDRIIQPCDTLGNFSFDYIRPGKWRIRLIESTLNENFIYNKTKTTIDVKPGEKRKLNFKARRKQKQLRMVSPPIKLTAKRQTKNAGGTK